jgi:DNA mismatch repair protein MutL
MTEAQQSAIRVLPRLLVDQIAAGEVVERPASVVRELVDNAIDAGATQIDVEIEGGGRTLIRVSDDGGGIASGELTLAFTSHATSKLSELGDLEEIATLGFRGEALASIGAVSRARIRSMAAASRHAAEIDDEGGTISPMRPAARARGTDVEIRDLFFNTPARRRFLRKDSTEAGHAVDVVIRHALARVEIGFRVVVDGKVVFDARRASAVDSQENVAAARRRRIAEAFGGEIESDLRGVSQRSPTLTLDGFVGTAATARHDASGIHVFVNDRYVHDRGALRVLRDATRDFLGSKQPVAFLFLSIDPRLVDVNVHPAKLEVRFRESGAVYGAIHTAIRRALADARPAAPADRLLSGAADGAHAASLRADGFEVRDGAPATAPLSDRADPRTPLFAEVPAEPLVPEASRYLRAFDTFLVLEGPDGIDLVDQHALHERVNFEELAARARAGGVPRQALLVPELVELTSGEMGLAEEFGDLWLSAGVDTASVGPSTLAIRGVPAGLRRIVPADLLRDLLSWARERKNPTGPELLEELLHRCACHASVKAGDALADAEIESLLSRAARLPADQTCPHGRPTRIRLTLRDLERAFERR